MSGFANLQLLGASSEDVCEYYERGLLAPGVDYETPPPYLHAIGDPMDDEGYVHLSQEPGMGYQINWDYILIQKSFVPHRLDRRWDKTFLEIYIEEHQCK